MFTGIIEAMGVVEEIIHTEGNLQIWIRSSISDELSIDQSVAHDGICLTVDELRPGAHRITAIHETISLTSIGEWSENHLVNLERCLPVDGRLDGHFVQGHVDTRATLLHVQSENGSWRFTFDFESKHAPLLVSKGSICINGVSLTLVEPRIDTFSVAIIPYTYEHTNFGKLKSGDTVNIEFDILGKYLLRWRELGLVSSDIT